MWLAGGADLLRREIAGLGVTVIKPPAVRHPGSSLEISQLVSIEGGVVVGYLSADIDVSGSINVAVHDHIWARYDDATQEWTLLVRGLKMGVYGSHGKWLIGKLLTPERELAVYDLASGTLRVSTSADLPLGTLPVAGGTIYASVRDEEGVVLSGTSMVLPD